MNLKNLTTKQLEALINNTKDLEILERAETEYVNRATSGDLDNTVFDKILSGEADEEVINSIRKYWRDV